MRLLNFLQEAIDIDNIKLKRIQCPFERGVCFEYEVDDIAFIGEYVYEERNKSITFGFRRAKGTRLMYSQNPDFNKYAGKVYAGMLKGLKEALKEFPETEILVGITVKDPDEKS